MPRRVEMVPQREIIRDRRPSLSLMQRALAP